MIARVLPIVLLSLLLVACSRGDGQGELIAFDGPTMGTRFTVKYTPSGPASTLPVVEAAVAGLLQRVNEQMSTYLPESELSRFNRAQLGRPFTVSGDTAYVVGLGLEISRLSGGAFDMTVGPLVNLWGFGPGRGEDRIPTATEIAAAKGRVGYHHIGVTQQPATLLRRVESYLDLSAIAKGFGVDKVADYLDSLGVESYLVEIGGELRARGHKPDGTPWRIGIESPLTEGRAVQRALQVVDIAMATSGDYRNYFERDGVRYSHTIDATTGQPISHSLASVTVLDPSAARADALATAINVMGPERGYPFAIKEQIPVFMIIKGDKGFTERSTPLFERYLAGEVTE